MFPRKMSPLLRWCLAAWISTVFILAPFVYKHQGYLSRASVKAIPTSRITLNISPLPKQPNSRGHVVPGDSCIDFHSAWPAFARSALAFSRTARLSLALAARGPPLSICS